MGRMTALLGRKEKRREGTRNTYRGEKKTRTYIYKDNGLLEERGLVASPEPNVAAGVAAEAATRAGVAAWATTEAGVTARAAPIVPLVASEPVPDGPLSRVAPGPSGP